MTDLDGQFTPDELAAFRAATMVERAEAERDAAVQALEEMRRRALALADSYDGASRARRPHQRWAETAAEVRGIAGGGDNG